MELPEISFANVVAGVVGVWYSVGKFLSWRGRNKTDIAQSAVDRSVADADSVVYKRLAERVELLEKAQHTLELKVQFFRRHIWKMEKIMIQAGLEPPKFDEDAFQATGE